MTVRPQVVGVLFLLLLAGSDCARIKQHAGSFAQSSSAAGVEVSGIGGGSDVCRHLSWKDSTRVVDRYKHKVGKLRSIVSDLQDKKCSTGCYKKWLEMKNRIRHFEGCSEILQGSKVPYKQFGVGGCRRMGSQRDIWFGAYDVVKDLVGTLDECKELCDKKDSCVAVSHWSLRKRCELWTKEPRWAQSEDGDAVQCHTREFEAGTPKVLLEVMEAPATSLGSVFLEPLKALSAAMEKHNVYPTAGQCKFSLLDLDVAGFQHLDADTATDDNLRTLLFGEGCSEEGVKDYLEVLDEDAQQFARMVMSAFQRTFATIREKASFEHDDAKKEEATKQVVDVLNDLDAENVAFAEDDGNSLFEADVSIFSEDDEDEVGDSANSNRLNRFAEDSVAASLLEEDLQYFVELDEVGENALPEAAELTVVFEPGKVGMLVDNSSGFVQHISDGQADRLGVRAGMRFLTVEGEPYSVDRFDAARVGAKSYEVTFAQDLETASASDSGSGSGSVDTVQRANEAKGPRKRTGKDAKKEAAQKKADAKKEAKKKIKGIKGYKRKRKAPHEPGCWLRMPMGCLKKEKKFQGFEKWRKVEFNHTGNNKADKVTCETKNTARWLDICDSEIEVTYREKLTWGQWFLRFLWRMVKFFFILLILAIIWVFLVEIGVVAVVGHMLFSVAGPAIVGLFGVAPAR